MILRGSFLFGLLALLIFFSSGIVSAAIGVTPSSYTIDFEPNYKGDFAFKFITDGDTYLDITPVGDLGEYVSVSKSRLDGSGTIVASLRLPEKLETPGLNVIAISGKQVPKTETGGFGIVGEVFAQIRVKVPFPGKYVSVGLQAENANQGEDVELILYLENLGDETVSATTSLDIIDSEGNFVRNIPVESFPLVPRETREIKKVIQTSDFSAGDYIARASVSYGGEKDSVAEAGFRLGRLFVDIINYTSVFEKDKINRFEITVESFWNSDINNVFAEVDIIGYDESFKTPSITLKGFNEGLLTGFFDTSEIDGDEFEADIVVHYEGQTTEERASLRLGRGASYVIIGIAVVVLLAGAVIAYILIRKKRKKGKSRK